MVKKVASLILIITIFFCGFSSKGLASGMFMNAQTNPSENIKTMEAKILMAQGEELSDQELNQYNQLQDEAMQNTLLNQEGGGYSGDNFWLYMLIGFAIAGVIVFAVAH